MINPLSTRIDALESKLDDSVSTLEAKIQAQDDQYSHMMQVIGNNLNLLDRRVDDTHSELEMHEESADHLEDKVNKMFDGEFAIENTEFKDHYLVDTIYEKVSDSFHKVFTYNYPDNYKSNK